MTPPGESPGPWIVPTRRVQGSGGRASPEHKDFRMPAKKTRIARRPRERTAPARMQTTMRLHLGLLRKLDDLALREGRSRTNLIEKILEDAIPRRAKELDRIIAATSQPGPEKTAGVFNVLD